MILSVEVLSDDALSNFRRHARLARREKLDRLFATGPIVALHRDLSEHCAMVSSGNARQTLLPELPELPKDQVGRYEDEEGVRLILFAKREGKPVLADLGWEPSKRFEDRLRQSAKIRKLRLRFYRIIDGYVVVMVESQPTTSASDANFLQSLGIDGT